MRGLPCLFHPTNGSGHVSCGLSLKVLLFTKFRWLSLCDQTEIVQDSTQLHALCDSAFQRGSQYGLIVFQLLDPPLQINHLRKHGAFLSVIKLVRASAVGTWTITL
jgi:hypothetical protein